MTDHPCLTELLEKFGDRVTKRQAQNWLDQVLELSKEGKSQDELLAAAARLGEEKIRQANLKKRNTALMLQAEMRIYGHIKNTWSDDMVEGMFSVLAGSAQSREGGRLSAYTTQRQYETKFRNGLVFDLERAGLRQDYISGDLDRDIAVELYLHNGGKNAQPTGKKNAKEIARIIAKNMEEARLAANKYGGDIRKLEGYIAEQTHDLYKIRAVSEDQWISDTYGRLDVVRTFKDIPIKDHMRIMKFLYKTLATGEQYKIPTSDPVLKNFERTFNIGDQVSKSRYLHFKDPDAWFEYNKMYGYGNLRETIDSQIRGLADAAGLMEVMGPNPREVFDRVRQKLGFEADTKTASRLTSNKKNFENILAEMDGTTRIPGNPTLAKWGAITRGLQGMAKLGGSVISGLSDIPISASELRYQGRGFLSAYNEAIIGSYNSIPKQFRKELIYQLGIYSDGMSYDLGSRYSGREDVRGWISRAQGLYFKLNLLQPWTDRMRGNMGLAMSGRLGYISDQPWSKIEPELRRTLGLYNITEKDWPALTKAVEIHEGSGKKFLTPTAVENLPDDVLSAEARNDLAKRLRAYFVDRTEIAVVNPDARTNALLRQGTRVGTVEGELLRMITQFKAFPTAVMQKVLARDVYSKGHRSMFEAMKSGSAMAGIAETLVMTTVFGYLSMTAKDILAGKKPRDPLSGTTMTAAMLQGGALGIYGDFILGTENRFGLSPIETVAGPVIGTASDAISLLQKIRDGDDASANALRLIKNNTPFANIFYTRMALDYLFFYRLQEYINPGYLDRMERRVEKENAQEWFMRPSDTIPYGGR